MINKPPLGSQINWAHPLARGLVACWLMNEGSGNMVQDYTLNQIRGIMTATCLWTGSPDGCATDFGTITSTTEYISITDPRIINLPETKNISVIISNKPNYTNNYDGRSICCLSWSGTDDLIIYPNGDTTLGRRIFWRDCGGNVISVASFNALDVWQVMAFTATIGEQKLYVNGSLIGTGANTLAGAGPFAAFNIGAYGEDARQNFGGSIGYVYLYDRPLSATEVNDLYVSPYAMFEQAPYWMWYQEAAGSNIPVFMHHYQHNLGR